jgi:hypothetical protein
MSASKANYAAANNARRVTNRAVHANGAKTRTYDIVAGSIINLRAGHRNQAETTEAAA